MPRIPPASRSSSSTRIRSIACRAAAASVSGSAKRELVAARPAGEVVDAGLPAIRPATATSTASPAA